MKRLNLGILVFIFFVSVFLLFLIAGDAKAAGINSSCESSFDCDAGLGCFSGKCLQKDNAGGGTGELTGVDLTIEGVFNIVNGLACWLTRVATFVMVIFIILAGFRFMNARGNATAFEGAKKNFNHVLIGLIVIMGVYVIIATVANAVGASDFSFIPLVC